MSSIIPPLMEGIRSKKYNLGPGSGFITCARALEILKSCPHIRVSFQHAVLRKKMLEVCERYLASDVQTDILA